MSQTDYIIPSKQKVFLDFKMLYKSELFIINKESFIISKA